MEPLWNDRIKSHRAIPYHLEFMYIRIKHARAIAIIIYLFRNEI